MKKNNYIYLFIVIILSFLLHPFLTGVFSFKYLAFTLSVLLYLSALYAVRDKRKYYYLLVFLGFIGIVMQVIPQVSKHHYLESIGMLFQIPFLGLLSWVLFCKLITERRVSSDTILGAISVYFLIGITWAYLYMGVEYFYSGSFSHTILNSNSAITPQAKSNFFYFSFVTLTTLGYGDITPVSSLAASLSILEGITGQMYIAILVAKLVAIYAIKQGKYHEDDK